MAHFPDSRPSRWTAGLLGVLFLSSCAPLAAVEDEPYVDYVMRRVSGGLSARTSRSIKTRFEGADTVALYADNLKKEGAPEEFLREASGSVLSWLGVEEEPWIRHTLLEALGTLDAATNRDAIAAYLDHDDPTLRARAAEHLGGVLTPQLERKLSTVYEAEPFWWVKTELLGALGAGTSDESLAVLHGALSEGPRDVRAAASQALGRRADARSVSLLATVLFQEDLVGVDSPAWALGRIGDEAAVQALEAAAFGPYPIVRKASAWALGKIGQPRSEPALARLLDDPDGMVRAEAADALGAIGGVPAARDLLSVLEGAWDETMYYAMLRISKEDLTAACDQLLAEPVAEADVSTTRRALCEQTLKDAGGEPVWFWSSGELHSIFYSPANAKAREVRPRKGRKAVGWEDAIRRELGGSPVKIDKGMQLTIWRGAFYDGETWLEVTTGPYDGSFWIREEDVDRIGPSSLREEHIWKNYGADTQIRQVGGRE